MKILSVFILCSSLAFAQQGALRNLNAVALDVSFTDPDNVTALKIDEVAKVLKTLITVSGLAVDESVKLTLCVTISVVNSRENAPGAFAYHVVVELVEEIWLPRVTESEFCTVWIYGNTGIAKKSEPHALIYATDTALRVFIREWKSVNQPGS